MPFSDTGADGRCAEGVLYRLHAEFLHLDTGETRGYMHCFTARDLTAASLDLALPPDLTAGDHLVSVQVLDEFPGLSSDDSLLASRSRRLHISAPAPRAPEEWRGAAEEHEAAGATAKEKAGATRCRLRALSDVLAVSRLLPHELDSYVCDGAGVGAGVSGTRESGGEPGELGPWKDVNVLGAPLCWGGGDDGVASDGWGSGGSACDVNVRERVSYMPTAARVEEVQRAAARHVDFDRVQFLQEISSVLNTGNCERAVAAPLLGYGFAATFHYAVLQLGRALQGRLSVTFAGFFVYGADATFGGVFQPTAHFCAPSFTEGTRSDATHAAELAELWFAEREHAVAQNGGWRPSTGGEGVAEDSEWLRLFACCAARHASAVNCFRLYRTRRGGKAGPLEREILYGPQVHEQCSEHDPRWVPPAYAGRRGSFWFRSMLAGYLFAPLPEYLAHFRHLETRLRPSVTGRVNERRPSRQSGIVGVHIRRGDACHNPSGIDHNQHCVATDKYLAAIRRMLAQYPDMKRVFVATNAGPLLIEEVRRGLAGVEVIVQDISDRAKYGCCEEGDLDCSATHECLHTDDRLRRSLAMRQEEGGGQDTHAHEIVSDILGLASCDALVGTMTSQVLRLALELSYFWRGHLVPWQSLDIPWCWEGYGRAPFSVGNRTFEYGC